MLRYSLLILSAFVVSTLSLCSSNNSSVENNRYTPSILTIDYSIEKIDLKHNKATLYLPKIKLKRIKEGWANYNQNNLRLSLNEDIQALKENIEELSELSKKLGINKLDPRYLPLYREAANWLGTRYRWAGNSKKGVDCSGFTNIILKEVFNIKVDRTSRMIAHNIGTELDVELLQPGDLVFFATRGRKNINHVGVYLGDKYFIHASTTQGVIVSNLNEQYYSRTFKKAGSI